MKNGVSSEFSEQLREEFLNDISKFQKELVREENLQNAFTRLEKLVNNFLLKAFGLAYKFTYEDLLLEAEENRVGHASGIAKICVSMSSLEFDHSKITKESLLTVVTDLSNLVDEISGVSAAVLPDLPAFEHSEHTPVQIDSLPPAEVPRFDIPPNLETKQPSVQQKPGLFSRIFGFNKKIIAHGGPKEEKIELQAVEENAFAPPKGEEFVTQEIQQAPVSQQEAITEDAPALQAADKDPVSFAVGPTQLKTADIPELQEDDLPEPKSEPTDDPEPKISPAKTPETLDEIVPAVSEDAEEVPAPKVPEEHDTMQLSADIDKPVPVQKHQKKPARAEKARPMQPVTKPVRQEQAKALAAAKESLVKKAHVREVKKPVSIAAEKPVVETPKDKPLSASELPKFESKLNEKERKFKKSLSDIVSNLELGKKGIAEEIRLLGKEKKVLEGEKQEILKRMQERKLPEYKEFETNINSQITDLDKKREELRLREKDIGERLNAVAAMEANIKGMSSKLSQDEKSMKSRAQFLESKEKVLKKIKDELSKKYDSAIQEIEAMKNEVKEKQESFIKLQRFYQERENKLSVEEENLLNEKRQYSRLVSGLLMRHMDIALSDLAATEKKITTLLAHEKELDESLNSKVDNYKDITKEKDSIKKDMEQKKKYFDTVELEFNQKAPEFEALDRQLTMKQEALAKKEPAVISFEAQLGKSELEIRSRLQSLELKELDLKSMEKDIDKIKYDQQNKAVRLRMLESQLQKRMESYDRLRRDVSASIAREKRAIDRIEKRLMQKGYYLNQKEKTVDTQGKVYDDMTKTLVGRSNLLNNPQELHLHQVTVSHTPLVDVGSPDILDILRLLNVAKDFIGHGQNPRARDTYLEIQKIFEDLNEGDKEEIYGEITNVFKPRELDTMRKDNLLSEANIDNLLQQFQISVTSGDIKSSEQIYQKLQEKYVQLPKEEKNRYYTAIMGLYNRLLSQQINTGMVY
ncbi:MAG: hypothetical protein HGA85_02345 [Nanoarchaeota archaeon]|nr:hypothetical protein [Nanoarchaeota archaeon]